jgi:hypothetical protein
MCLLVVIFLQVKITNCLLPLSIQPRIVLALAQKEITRPLSPYFQYFEQSNRQPQYKPTQIT